MKIKKNINNSLKGLFCIWLGLNVSACEEHFIPDELTNTPDVYYEKSETKVGFTTATVSFKLSEGSTIGSAEECYLLYYKYGETNEESGNYYDRYYGSDDNYKKIPIPLSSFSVGNVITLKLEKLSMGTEYRYEIVASRGISHISIGGGSFKTMSKEEFYSIDMEPRILNITPTSAELGVYVRNSHDGYLYDIHEIGFFWSTNREELENWLNNNTINGSRLNSQVSEQGGVKKAVVAESITLTTNETMEFSTTLSNLNSGDRYYVVPYVTLDTKSENPDDIYILDFGMYWNIAEYSTNLLDYIGWYYTNSGYGFSSIDFSTSLSLKDKASFSLDIKEVGFRWGTNEEELNQGKGQKVVLPNSAFSLGYESVQFTETLSGLKPGEYYIIPYILYDSMSDTPNEKYQTLEGEMSHFTIDPMWYINGHRYAYNNPASFVVELSTFHSEVPINLEEIGFLWGDNEEEVRQGKGTNVVVAKSVTLTETPVEYSYTLPNPTPGKYYYAVPYILYDTKSDNPDEKYYKLYGDMMSLEIYDWE